MEEKLKAEHLHGTFILLISIKFFWNEYYSLPLMPSEEDITLYCLRVILGLGKHSTQLS